MIGKIGNNLAFRAIISEDLMGAGTKTYQVDEGKTLTLKSDDGAPPVIYNGGDQVTLTSHYNLTFGEIRLKDPSGNEAEFGPGEIVPIEEVTTS